MNVQTPDAIARYLHSRGADNEASLSEYFHAHAVVRDEGQTFRGLNAISAWKAAAEAKYQYRLMPLGLSREGGTFKLLAHLEGNFPGNRVDLIHVFGLKDGLIDSLEIRLPIELEGRRALVTGGTKGIGAAAVAGGNRCLRCRQGCPVDLQQEPLQGSRSKGRARGTRGTRLGRDRSCGEPCRENRQRAWNRLRRCTPLPHELPRRHTAWASCQAPGGRRAGRVSGVAARSLHHGGRIPYRRGNSSRCLRQASALRRRAA